MPRVRPEHVIAAPGHTLLIVDHPDRRAGGVPVIADGMAINRRRQSFRLRGVERAGQRLVSGRSELRVLQREILKPVRGFESVFQPLRRVGFPGPQHVRIVLCVGRESEVHDPEIAVEHVAALNDISAGGSWRRQTAFSPDGNCRMEPLAVPHLRDSLAHPPRNVFVGGDARHDDPIRKGFPDHLVGDAHDVPIGVGFFRQLRLEPADGKHLGRLHAAGVLRGKRFHQIVALVGGEPVGVVVILGRVDPDHFRIARLDDFPQPVPLPVVLRFFEHEQPVVIEPADREMLDAFVAAAVEEDEDGSTPR